MQNLFIYKIHKISNKHAHFFLLLFLFFFIVFKNTLPMMHKVCVTISENVT